MRSTAARWADVPEMSQNCSFRHHSSRPTPDHRTSKIASKVRVMLMIRRYTRNEMLSVSTMKCPEKRDNAGRKQ